MPVRCAVLCALLAVACADEARSPPTETAPAADTGAAGSIAPVPQPPSDPEEAACWTNDPDTVAWMCEKTIRIFCVRISGCTLQTFDSCFRSGMKAVCDGAQAIRDACALEDDCWPWIKARSCAYFASPNFQLPDSCVGQVL